VTLTTAATTPTQEDISSEIEALHGAYRTGRESGAPAQLQPDADFAPYRSSILRHPTKDPYHVDPETIELFSPAFGHRDVAEVESDLTIQRDGEPLGQRIVVSGQVLDGDGRPVRHQLVEIWHANSAGRYPHKGDQHPAPLDPNFTGTGRCITDDNGVYRFLTTKPGAYPWRNHRNAWRPAHIHFSVFGSAFTQRIITQMYFPGDPLFPLDPIFQAILDPKARERLVGEYDHSLSTPEWALGYRWNIVLTGSQRTWTEPEGGDA
jgi:protocatechuate 3,4-dioxygenase, beta subunit